MIGEIALTAVAKGVYAQLAAQTALMALLTGGLQDHAPQDPAFPLVLLAGFDEDQSDTGGLQVRKVSFEAHIYSAYLGMTEAYTILALVVAALHRQDLTLDGWVCEASWYDGATQQDAVLVDADLVQQLVARFHVDVMEA